MGFKTTLKSNISQSLYIGLMAIIFAFCTNLVHSKGLIENLAEDAGLETIALEDLTKNGRDVYALIKTGGPFAYEKDGVVFGNRERILPQRKRGYYREYTVKTFGSRNRGAKRIVCGGYQVQAPDVCYYTADHYASFRKIKY